MIKNSQIKKTEYSGSGFGTRTDNQPERLINQDGTFNVRKKGLGFFAHFSVFHFLISANWTVFNILVAASYILIISAFGLVYYFFGVEQLGLISENPLADFLHSVYYSAQTFSTVGYGRANPLSHATNLIAVAEMLVGMMYLALAAGLLFARFSRPVAKIVFSKMALIAPYRGGKGFMLRLANAKVNMLLNVEVKVLLVMISEEDGKEVRKYYELPLEMTRINILAMSWTVVHPIDESSPLFGMTKEMVIKSKAEFMVLLSGYNDTLSQTIHSRTSYDAHEIEWDAQFVPVFHNRNGITEVSIDKIGDFQKVTFQ
jgi:inward rectifier potassium channel